LGAMLTLRKHVLEGLRSCSRSVSMAPRRLEQWSWRAVDWVRNRGLFAVTDLGAHATFLATQFSPTFTSLLRTHAQLRID
jgi:hypothetical protein